MPAPITQPLQWKSLIKGRFQSIAICAGRRGFYPCWHKSRYHIELLWSWIPTHCGSQSALPRLRGSWVGWLLQISVQISFFCVCHECKKRKHVFVFCEVTCCKLETPLGRNSLSPSKANFSSLQPVPLTLCQSHWQLPRAKSCRLLLSAAPRDTGYKDCAVPVFIVMSLACGFCLLSYYLNVKMFIIFFIWLLCIVYPKKVTMSLWKDFFPPWMLYFLFCFCSFI